MMPGFWMDAESSFDSAKPWHVEFPDGLTVLNLVIALCPSSNHPLISAC